MTAPITTYDIAVGDHHFRVAEAGPSTGRPVLFLHGSGPGVTALTNWEWLIGELGDEFRCIAPDVLGFGDSSHPNPPPQGLGAFTRLRVETLVGLLDELGIDEVTLVGNSMGGIISAAMTLDVPERVRALVLMGTGGAPVGLTPGLVQLITFYDEPTAANMASLLSQFVHDPAHFGDDLQSIAEARMPRAMLPEVERSHRATFGPGDGVGFTAERIATITQPALVVHGDDDRIVPIASGEWFAEHLPNARFEVFPETGHWLQIEQGPAFAALLRDFLAETSEGTVG
ncbi:MAG: alpha/beta fold hydrolase [Actinobacteria bacterium]|nr:alpha/beta fold hydrolase [Actinomycetota bacterium]